MVKLVNTVYPPSRADGVHKPIRGPTMLVADLRALNAKLDAHLRAAEVGAAESGHTRTGEGRHANNDTEVHFTIHTNDDYSQTTYEDEKNRVLKFKCISPSDTVRAFFQNTTSPIHTNVMEYFIYEGDQQVGTGLKVLLYPNTLEFEKKYQRPKKTL
jgi:hypothetical protein